MKETKGGYLVTQQMNRMISIMINLRNVLTSSSSKIAQKKE